MSQPFGSAQFMDKPFEVKVAEAQEQYSQAKALSGGSTLLAYDIMFNPMYSVMAGYYEMYDGHSMQYGSLGNELDGWERAASGAGATLKLGLTVATTYGGIKGVQNLSSSSTAKITVPNTTRGWKLGDPINITPKFKQGTQRRLPPGGERKQSHASSRLRASA
jgi:hypothetical protein